MVVTFLSSGLKNEYGGAAISESSLIRELSKEITVNVIVPENRWDKEFLNAQGIKISNAITLYDTLKIFYKSSHWLNQLILKSDLIHLNGHWRISSFLISLFAYLNNIPYVIHSRGMFYVGHRKKILKKIYNLVMGNFTVGHASKIIALSDFEKKHFAPYHTPENKILVIPNGIPSPKVSSENFNTYKKPTSTYLLYIGRLEKRKNILFLINAFKNIHKQIPELKLVLVGPIENEYDKILATEIDRLEIKEKVMVLPALYGNEKHCLMKEALSVVYPTLEEPFGRVPFEAIAAGTFCIIPDRSGSSEYLSPLFPESIYQEGNSQSLENVILALSSISQTQRAEKINQGQKWIRDNLNWNCITKKVISLYLEVARPILQP